MAEYIEREDAIDTVLDAYFNTPKVNLKGELFYRGLLKMPAADVAPVVHGRWISWEEADNFTPSPHRHECSVCHDAAQVLVNNIELLSDYCPNCGARMDGGECR